MKTKHSNRLLSKSCFNLYVDNTWNAFDGGYAPPRRKLLNCVNASDQSIDRTTEFKKKNI